MTTSGLELTLLLLGSAVLGVVAFRMLHLPPMLGYLAVGVVIGPHALNLADNNETTHALAEFGVVFLMFSIGLEFSLAQAVGDAAHRVRPGLAQVLADHPVATVALRLEHALAAAGSSKSAGRPRSRWAARWRCRPPRSSRSC
jgi:CPA2 family monovalent cation:H+ antiporter-2